MIFAQAMSKGAKMLEKGREMKKQLRSNPDETDLSITDGTSAITGVPKDRTKEHQIDNH